MTKPRTTQVTTPTSLGLRLVPLKTQGFKLQSLKLYTPTRALLEAHYADLSSKGFFAGMITTMMSGPVCCMVWEGLGAVATGRVVCSILLSFSNRQSYIYQLEDS